MKSPIVLLTDFGVTDSYVGILKGVIFSIAPRAVVIDLSHGIEPQNIEQGAHILKTAHKHFPPGSIFVCVVDPGVGTSREIVCARTKNYFFIGPDNGLLSLASREGRLQIRSVQNSRYFLSKSPSPTFHARDIMSPVAARLFLKGDSAFAAVGPVKTQLKALPAKPVLKLRNLIRGRILYFDHFGNAITNICRSEAPESFWSQAKVYIKGKLLGPLRQTYLSGPKRLCALWNSSFELEIALPCGSARQAGLQPGDRVVVRK